MADTLIDFLRHGEPVGGRRYRGHGIDDPLTEKGRAQMRAALGDACPWDAIVTSPLVRCREFADWLGARHGLPVRVDTRFREVGFGTWEGRAPDDIQTENPDEYHAFHQDPVNCRPPGAEPLDAFGERVGRALGELWETCAGQHLLVVAHAGVIRAALGSVLGAEAVGWYRARIDNAGLTRFRHGAQGVRLEFHNSRRLPEAMPVAKMDK